MFENECEDFTKYYKKIKHKLDYVVVPLIIIGFVFGMVITYNYLETKTNEMFGISEVILEPVDMIFFSIFLSIIGIIIYFMVRKLNSIRKQNELKKHCGTTIEDKLQESINKRELYFKKHHDQEDRDLYDFTRNILEKTRLINQIKDDESSEAQKDIKMLNNYVKDYDIPIPKEITDHNYDDSPDPLTNIEKSWEEYKEQVKQEQKESDLSETEKMYAEQSRREIKASEEYYLKYPECRRPDETEEDYLKRHTEWLYKEGTLKENTINLKNANLSDPDLNKSIINLNSNDKEQPNKTEQSDSVETFIKMLDNQYVQWKKHEVKKA